MLPYIAISDSFTFYLYPFFIGLSWAIAYQLALYFKDLENLSFKNFNLFFWGNFITSWIGAKIFYLITINNYTELLINSNFWLGGGFVFYGGLIFCLLYSQIFLKITNQSWKSLSFLLSIIPLAHGIGRVGCFLAGCCYGVATDFFLSVHMHDHDRHPVQLYETFFLFLLSYSLSKKRSLSLYLISYSLFRFGVEFLRGDKIRGEYLVFSTSQWVSILIITMIAIQFLTSRLVNNRSSR